jgi:hypothetical protein
LAGSSVTGLKNNPVKDDRPTLASQGIDKNLAHQARTLGALSDDEFERVISDAREASVRAVGAAGGSISARASSAGGAAGGSRGARNFSFPFFFVCTRDQELRAVPSFVALIKSADLKSADL